MKKIIPIFDNKNISLIAPPSKSVAIRLLAGTMLSYFPSHIENFPDCDDATAALNIAHKLGYNISKKLSTIYISPHSSQSAFSNKLHALKINVGESALCLRMFPFIASHFGTNIAFEARGSLLKRDMSALKQLLQTFGISNSSNIIVNNKIKHGSFEIDCSHSSQELTGLLFVLPLCSGDSEIVANNLVSSGYITLTLAILQQFGIKVEQQKNTFLIPGNQNYQRINSYVEGDWSIASNFLVLGAIAGNVSIAGLDTASKQPDKAILNLFDEIKINYEIVNSIIKIRKSEYSGFDFDATNFPDLLPPLVVLAFNATSPSRIYGLSRLINKESNRKDVLLKNFLLMGGDIKIVDDHFEIKPSRLSGGSANAANDHRIAMSIAIASALSNAPITLDGADSVSKSFPSFWQNI